MHIYTHTVMCSMYTKVLGATPLGHVGKSLNIDQKPEFLRGVYKSVASQV